MYHDPCLAMSGLDIALTCMASFSGPSKLTPYESSFVRAVLFETTRFIVLSRSTSFCRR